MESVPSFSARAESHHRVANIALCGEFDMAAGSLFAAQVTPFDGNGGRSSILDLHDLMFLDSAGVHAFVKARTHAKANGQQLSLMGAHGLPRRVFELTNTMYLLDQGEPRERPQ